MAEIKKIDVLSTGKIIGLLYVIFGFVAGLFFTIATLAGVDFSSATNPLGSFGAWSVLVLPILYGIIGFLAGIVIAALYNLLVKWIGGIKIEIK